MRRILLQEAQVGMSLAADALNSQQMLLLKQGVSLTEKRMRMLKSWGVETITVQQSHTDRNETPCASVSSNDVEQQILPNFADTIENPIMAEICRVAAEIVHERTRRT